MALTDLTSVVAPPATPAEAGPPEKLVDIERALTKLPADVVEFSLTYGSGEFAHGSIEVFNPFASDYLESVEQVSSAYRDLRKSEGPEFIPYDISPISPGLLVWGTFVDGHIFFWLTEGLPDQWPLILMSVDGRFERHEMTLTSFLAKLFRGEMESHNLWSLEWVKANLVGATFRPKRIRA